MACSLTFFKRHEHQIIPVTLRKGKALNVRLFQAYTFTVEIDKKPELTQ